MSRWIWSVSLSVFCWSSAIADEPLRVLKPIGQLPASIREASGLCKSRQHEGVFWTHSDSGNPPHLFAITRTGQLLATYRVNGAVNLDWESIETDADGRLYLCDVGNNLPGGPFKVRWIDIVREPDPRAAVKTAISGEAASLLTIDVERKLHFAFPDKPHDVEGVVRWQNELLLFAKVREHPAPVFALSLKPDESTKSPRTVMLTPLDNGVTASRITGAALTPKRDRLALCSYDYVQVFELPGKNENENEDQKNWPRLDRCPNRVLRFAATQTEGCEWDGDNLLLISEDGKLFDLPIPRP